MKIKLFFAIALGLLFLLESCSIDQRLYRPGYHVEWGGKKRTEPTTNPSAGDAKSSETDVFLKSEDAAVYRTELDSSTNQGATISGSVEHDKRLKRSSQSAAHQKEQKKLDHSGKKSFDVAASGEVNSSEFENGRIEEVKKEMDGLAVASFVLGIVGFLFFPCSILAIIFGSIALGRIKADPDNLRGQGFAIAGVVLGVCGILVLILALMLLFELFSILI